MKHLLILMLAVLSLVSLTLGQQSTDLEFSPEVASAGGLLTVAGVGPIWTPLRAGVSYNCIADYPVNVSNVTPVDPNNPEAMEPGVVDITGAPGAQVVVTFVMPTKLLPTGGIGVVNMTYDNQSASVMDLNVSGVPFDFFNPTVPKTITIDAAGTAQLLLAGNPAVSADALDGDVFMGYGLVTVEYTGL